MVHSKRRGKGASKLAGSHQKCWHWGRHAVVEALRAGRWIPLEVRVADRLAADETEAVRVLADRLDVPVEPDDFDRLTQLCGTAEHQGFLGRMPAYPYVSAESLVGDAGAGARLFLVLDGIQDPHNFGAMLRSAEVLGVDGVFVGAQGQAEVTPHVARASAGAVNHLPIARVASLAELLRDMLAPAGVQIVGASEKRGGPPADADFRRSTAVVIGNEGTGISDEVLARCDLTVAIPQSGRVGSLNAATAAGILLYEARRQRSVVP